MKNSPETNGRLTAFGNQLIEVHLWLREELDRLRDAVEAHLDGRGERPRELKAHCLAFCSALTRHHTGEDGGAFPVLAREVPELRPVLEQLEHDHHMVTGILLRLEKLLDDLPERAGQDEARRVRGELEALSALLESHFRFEEKRIVAALNALDVPDWHASRPGFLLTDAGDAPGGP